jgi:sugar phosphate isomerase/epimerase
MRELTRRSWLQWAASAGVAPLLSETLTAAEARPFRLGMCVATGDDPEEAIARVHQLGLPTCHVYLGSSDDRAAAKLKAALARHQVEVTALMTLGPGEMVWDFIRGPSTLGLVPRQHRQARIDALKRASDFALRVGIPAQQTHCGFIPEDPLNPVYQEVVQAIRDVARQETPVAMLRVISDVGLENVGVGLDTANLILCGTGNPVDAVEMLGRHIRSVHAKDGLSPADPRRFGKEVPLGHGKVDFPKVLERLLACDYGGPITIEREVPMPQQLKDVAAAKDHLEPLLRQMAQSSRLVPSK